jgi:hypothetical protein
MNTPSPAGWDELSAQPLDHVDDQIMSRLAALYDVIDPVPSDLVERLQFAITLDALNAELAELQQLDSLASRAESTDEAKTLTFTTDSLTTMVTISADGPDRVRIDGWCAPGAGMIVELRQVSATVQTEADEDGRFVFSDVEHGLTRFVVREGGGEGTRSPVVTPAVEL